MIMYTGLVFVTLYLIYLCCNNLNLNSKWKRNSIPTNWPIFGMMPGLLLNIVRIHDYATALFKQNGGTILFKGPWFTNMEMMVTCDPANVHYILCKNFKNFQKGPDFRKMFDVLGDGIFVAELESWENQRKTLMAIIKDRSYQKFVATSSWNKLEVGLIPILDHVSEMRTEVDLQELFQRFAFDCSCVQVLGHDPVSLCKELPYLPYEKAFVDAEEAILQRHILPETLWKFQKWLQIGKERKLAKSKEILDHFLSSCISLKSQKFTEKDRIVTNGNEDFDLLTSYMKLIAEKGTHEYSTEAWKDNMLNLIFAGKDTISASLTWFFWLLSQHPEEETKIRLEIMTNLQVNEDGKLIFSNMDHELKKLYYLHGALCETLRLYPPVPIQHKAPVEPDKLPSGHRISPNTKTLLFFYSMGRMESIWGKDCLEFKPGRWINSALGHIKTEPASKFTAFNAGPRSCLGKEMSFVQLKIVAAAIISRYHIQVVESHPVCPSSSVILHMKHGLKVKVSNHI